MLAGESEPVGVEGPVSRQQNLAGLSGEHHSPGNRLIPTNQLACSPGAHFLITKPCVRGQDEPQGSPGGEFPIIKITHGAHMGLEVLPGFSAGRHGHQSSDGGDIPLQCCPTEI